MPENLFDGKYFNPEVFAQYMTTVPESRKNALIRQSGILTPLNNIADLFRDQTGGNYAKIPFFGELKGRAQNYNGDTDIIPDSMDSYLQGVVVTGRMKGWVEKDFTMDLASANFWEAIAAQVNRYYEGVDQDTLIATLKGVFDMPANDFTDYHTYDITDAEGEAVKLGRTTLNNAIQQAAGDNKNIFTMCFMHSVTATGIENMNATEYMKYMGKDGVQREIGISEWDGRLVIIDDNLPTVRELQAAGVNGVYTLTVDTALVAGDSISILAGSTAHKVYAFQTGVTSKTAQAAAIARLFEGDRVFTVEASSDTVTFTQKTPGRGVCPVITPNDSNTGSVTIATTLPGVKPVYKTCYTTFVMGQGSIGTVNCGVQTPYELVREGLKNGGQTVLATRQRKIFAPVGISFTMNYMASKSPTDEELAYGGNWELVHNGAFNREYIDHKCIPIMRILSLG